MRALLRYQATLAMRLAGNLGVVLNVALVIALVLLVAAGIERQFGILHLGFALPMTGVIVAIPFLAMLVWTGMVTTLDGLDAIRWTTPIRARTVFSAHVLFWILICGVPAAAVAGACGPNATAAALLFLDLMLVGAASAVSAPAFQRLVRRPTLGGLGLALGLVLGAAGPCGLGVVLAWKGDGALGAIPIAIVLGVTLVIGTRTFLRDERLPAESGGHAPIGRARSVRRADTGAALPPAAGGPGRRGRSTAVEPVATARTWSPPKVRTPIASILRATWPPFWAGIWVVIGIGQQFFPVENDVPLMFVVVAASSLGQIALASWKWLITTPIDRARAFRLLYLPIVAVVIAGAGTRLLVVELGDDRSVFFHDFRSDSWPRGHRILGFDDMLTWDEQTKSYPVPEASLVAGRIRDHLLAEFGLRVPTERIESGLRRGWPVVTRDGAGPERLNEMFDAIEHVRADLATELRSADRVRGVMRVVTAVLVALVVLRGQLTGFRRARLWLLALVVPVWIAAFAPMIAPKSALATQVAAAWSSAQAALQDTGAPVLVLLAGTVAIGFLLWRSSLAAFKRLDLSDLPPQSVTKWWGNRV